MWQVRAGETSSLRPEQHPATGKFNDLEPQMQSVLGRLAELDRRHDDNLDKLIEHKSSTLDYDSWQTFPSRMDPIECDLIELTDINANKYVEVQKLAEAEIQGLRSSIVQLNKQLSQIQDVTHEKQEGLFEKIAQKAAGKASQKAAELTAEKVCSRAVELAVQKMEEMYDVQGIG